MRLKWSTSIQHGERRRLALCLRDRVVGIGQQRTSVGQARELVGGGQILQVARLADLAYSEDQQHREQDHEQTQRHGLGLAQTLALLVQLAQRRQLLGIACAVELHAHTGRLLRQALALQFGIEAA